MVHLGFPTLVALSIDPANLSRPPLRVVSMHACSYVRSRVVRVKKLHDLLGIVQALVAALATVVSILPW